MHPLLPILLLLAPPPAPAPMSIEVFSPDGSIGRTTITAADLPRAKAAAGAEVVTIQQTGPPADRYDLVFIGDGYTAGQQALFHRQAVARWAQITAYEPFRTLKDKFNVWQVNAVSNQSGSDNDPTPGVRKDTALGGGFYCDDLARLICVDTAVTRSYAALAPGADQALVLVNSTTYGGSGGTVTVSSGGNAQSGDIVVHELGHSIGGLADEYGGPGTYSGGEPSEPNATKRPDTAKWASYLGRPTPDGGVIGAFEGGAYFDKGVYRPSQNSIMRTLGNEFNLIGIDRLTAAINART
ncbi:M64 family metallopeptidase [Actinoplanes sp. NPDC051470]|uniref:M64 family metallopeptidase n=1 Tax=Actinoplanes sp. NPDC051470 TaxID=3157224 RepID=UPI00341F927E